MKERKKDKHKINVLVVDDHPIVRQGLLLLFNQRDDMNVCGEAEDARQAMQAIAAFKPDIAIIDITLKDSNGLELIKQIKERYANLPLLVLSVHDESLYAERALRAGARGYIMKEELTNKVVDAVRLIVQGKIYLSAAMSEKMLNKLVRGDDNTASPLDRLSDRELEVFQLIGHGHQTHDIAETMHLSPKTVQSYRARIKEKLNLESSSELLQHAFQWVHEEHTH
ncbi:MAG: DNA-binding response regulator [Candidatus Omnitrophota bacterium]|nr:MAG: DNA-binding response regulator [Candidatus Omnitrophota bacterium]